MSSPADFALESWLCNALPWLVPPIRFTRLPGGNSNVTVRAQDADGASVVLRRGPAGAQPGTHDVLREHRILSALAMTDVPAPQPLAFCHDTTVWGSEFSVVDHVAGTRISCADDAASLSVAERQTLGHALVDGLVGVHAVGPDVLRVAGLQRSRPYLERQLATWSRHVHAAQSSRSAQLLALADRLSGCLPQPAENVLVHGDYRLDNCLVSAQLTLRAILDWELATLGDPLADLSLLCVYWTHEGIENNAHIGMPAAPTTLRGFPTIATVLDSYATATGRDLSQFSRYLAFAHWKVACIADGVVWRYRQRVQHLVDESVTAAMDEQIGLDIERAAAALDRPAARFLGLTSP
jgi:aminoglycoside phosphotransferase (APT) family kinase protein